SSGRSARSPVVAVAGASLSAGGTDQPAAVAALVDERSAALPADDQPLQQMARAISSRAAPPSVLLQLLARRLDHRLIDQRRDRDLNPILGRCRMPVRGVPLYRGARRPERELPRAALAHLAAAVVGAAAVGRVAEDAPDQAGAPPLLALARP